MIKTISISSNNSFSYCIQLCSFKAITSKEFCFAHPLRLRNQQKYRKCVWVMYRLSKVSFSLKFT
ncbi:hypothetical protein CS542_01290 [Pedobacter sp. IW39]|nr:hypothetical protein CS542_01290 [Pedobacter sp. IW39]